MKHIFILIVALLLVSCTKNVEKKAEVKIPSEPTQQVPVAQQETPSEPSVEEVTNDMNLLEEEEIDTSEIDNW
jgi:PBP1b-binding outer membrane lipoprotein LpoB